MRRLTEMDICITLLPVQKTTANHILEVRMETPGSFLLTAEIVEKAINMVLPAITTAMDNNILGGHDLHIVVMNPGVRPHEVRDAHEAILCERSFGVQAKWNYPYKDFARAKAFASWRTGLPTGVIRQVMPYLLKEKDTLYYGSAVLDGIVVGTSGVQEWFDEWVSYLVAATCRALCIEAMQGMLENDPHSSFFWERAEGGTK